MAELAKGFFFEKPSDKAPAFVKGRVSIKVAEAITMLQASQNNAGYVNLDLLESKDGQKQYFTINDYQPKPKDDAPALPDYPEDEINPEDVPF
jgi:hypothetical protein